MAANGLVNCAYCQKYVLEATHLCLNEFAEKTGLFSIAEPPFLDFELETESLASHLQDVETMDYYYYDYWTSCNVRAAGLDCLVR